MIIIHYKYLINVEINLLTFFQITHVSIVLSVSNEINENYIYYNIIYENQIKNDI